jgi:hypothetical protein
MTHKIGKLDVVADAWFQAEKQAYARAVEDAERRSSVSYFDQHVVRSIHGHYWVADEADWEVDLALIRDCIVHTVPSLRSDEA